MTINKYLLAATFYESLRQLYPLFMKLCSIIEHWCKNTTLFSVKLKCL